MPDDDKFLGTTSFNKIHAPGNGPYDDNTLQREQTCYFFVRSIGLPWNYRRYVALYVNGLRRGTLMEDTQVPNGDVIAERFPDDQDGELFKLQPWFEFDAATAGLKNNFENKSWCMLNVYNTTDATTGARVKKLARYRYNFLARGTKGTANNFTNVYKLVDAVNLPVNTTQYLTNMDALVDSENWMRTFAVEHAVGNWDSVGAQNAQNMYGYKPENGKWNLLIWDYNIVLGNSSSWTPGQNVWPVLFTAGDTGMSNIYTTPKFVRAYFRALKDIANGPMTASVVEPMMDSKFNQFTLAGVNVTSPDGAGVKTFISQARTALQGILAGQNANTAFTLNNPATSTVTNNYVILTGLAPVDARTITIN